MSGLQDKNGILHVDGVPLPRIAQEVGTPTYVYSASSIRSQFTRLRDVMRDHLPADRQPLLCYACKANSHLAILNLLSGLGCGLEIVSEGELIRGLKAGFSSSKIVSTGVGKTESEITALLNAGVYQINVESLPELERIGQIANKLGKTANIVFRLNPDVQGGGHDKISTGRKSDKFGISAADVFKGFARAAAMKYVNALGISMHIGSQVFDVGAFKTAFAKLPEIVGELRAQGYTVSRLDIGGGFPIRYRGDENLLNLEAYAEWVRDIILPLNTEIVMEPGRYMVGGAGVLLTKTEYVKESDDRSFVILDAAMNDLMRPALYDAYHGIEKVENRDAPQKTYDIVGPVCESSDRFALGRSLPEMKEGDLAILNTAGAYGFAMASNYNTRPLVAEVMVDEGQMTVIRKRQTYDELLAAEIIPAYSTTKRI